MDVGLRVVRQLGKIITRNMLSTQRVKQQIAEWIERSKISERDVDNELTIFGIITFLLRRAVL